MNIIVEFWSSEGLRVESDQMYFGVIWRHNRENDSESVVGGISFEDDLCVRNPMSKYQSSSEGFFEGFEGVSAFWSEVPSDSFSGQTCQWNCDIGVVKDESPIKVSKSEEGLNVLDFARFGPFLDGLDLVIGY